MRHHPREAPEQQTYRQLKTLYEISKAIASFETIEQSFPTLLSLSAKVLRLRISVLIESRGGLVTTTVWHAEGTSPQQVDAAVALAKQSYAQLVGVAPLRMIPRLNGFDSIILPLVAYQRPTFGVLLLQGSTPADEVDLAFADALTNLIAVAVDRYYTANEVVKIREKHITDLEAERELRESFVSLLSHDLRNPLGAAKLYAGLILRGSEDHEGCKKKARQITNSIERADHMIENLLDANRIRAGERLPLKIEEFDLEALLDAILKELSVVHGDRFVLKAAPEVRGYWSRDGIHRALENLINNAIKYGHPDRPITVSLKQTPQTVQISVHNEGNPIPPNDLATLFQPYRRTKAAQSSSIRGWGLGLTLVQGVVEAHGGTVKVESESDRGTTFTMELPKDSRPH